MERGNNNLIITEKTLTLINLERQIWKLKLREGTLSEHPVTMAKVKMLEEEYK